VPLSVEMLNILLNSTEVYQKKNQHNIVINPIHLCFGLFPPKNKRKNKFHSPKVVVDIQMQWKLKDLLYKHQRQCVRPD